MHNKCLEYTQKYNKISAFVILNILILGILYILYGEINIREPLAYEGDILYNYSLIKSIIYNGWYVENPFLGNGTYNLYGFNFGNTLQFMLIKILTLFTHNVFLIFNLFYFLSFFLVGNVSFYILKILNKNSKVSVLFSILFTFLPFHQLKILQGICFIDYSCVPIFILFTLYIIQGSNKITWKWYILAFIIGLFNIYYVFFGLGILFFGLIIRLINEKHERITDKLKAFANIFIPIIIGVLINLSPTIWGALNNKIIPVERKPQQAETFSFKIIEILLPRLNHRVDFLSDISAAYQNKTGSHSEGMMAALGIIGSIGFIYLLLVLFKKKENLIKKCALLNVGILLLGTQGGFGTIIAYVIPAIRVYARLSVYIAFVSFLGLSIVFAEFDYKLLHLKHKKNFLNIVFLLMLILGISDQMIKYTGLEQEKLIEQKNIDKEFVEKVSGLNILNDGRVWQMPYKPFESGGFEYIKGYLFDDGEIIWSGGILPNSALDAWADKLEKMNTQERIEQLVLEGYNGIWLSKEIFKIYNRLDEFNTLIDELTVILGKEPIYSGDKSFVYFDMCEFSKTLETDNNKIIFPKYSKEFYPSQIDQNDAYLRWCGEIGYIDLHNWNEKEALLKVSFTLKSVEDSVIEIKYNDLHILSVELEAYVAKDVVFYIDCKEGINRIAVENSAEAIDSPIGVKEISFCLINDNYSIVGVNDKREN